jgi:hypothetical protein
VAVIAGDDQACPDRSVLNAGEILEPSECVTVAATRHNRIVAIERELRTAGAIE